MYESFYKLSGKPFRLSPDPQFFYPSAGHKRALSYLLYGLNQGEGFVVITGAPGTGKTTLAHKLLSQIDAQSVVVAHLASTQIEAEDLLRLVAASFKLRSEHVSKASLLKDIESFLLARARERKRCLLVVDEAQNLPPRSIEELRMLSNFQIGNKALMQVFLLGQEQFRVMLDSPQFEQLRQRVIADFHLHSLDAEETRRYIEARLQHVGWQNDPQLDAGAHALIFEYTGGLPRRINMFCDRLLLYGYLEGLHMLARAAVSAVIAELHNEFLPRKNNVVSIPGEPPTEYAATLQPAPNTEVIAAPLPDTRSAPIDLESTVHTVRDLAAGSKSARPVASLVRPPAKSADPGAIKTASTKPAAAATMTSPREVPESAVANLLLAGQSEFNTRSEPPPTERVATLQPASKAVVMAASLPYIPPAPIDLDSTVHTARDIAARPKSTRPVASIARHSATPADPDATIIASAKPAAMVATASPREAPESTIAAFLLADQSKFNTRDELSRTAPSLASTESRWLMMVTMIISAGVILLLLAYWFYPSIQGALQHMQPPGAESRTPFTGDTGESTDTSAGLVQQITDPSENVLTEKRILTSPASANSESGAANAPRESPGENNESEGTVAWWEHKAPAAQVADNRSAMHPVNPPSKTTEQAQKNALIAKPGNSAVPRQVTAPVSPNGANTTAATAPKHAPIAQLEAGTPTNAISEQELALLLIKFARYYNDGNLPLFLALFDPQVRTEDNHSIDAIRNDYTELFKKTATRQIVFGDVHWEYSGRLAQGSAPFEVLINAAEGEPARYQKGDVTFHVEKKDNGPVIVEFYHTPR